MQAEAYGALLFVSFGGPERQEDVLPFLENVLRGKNVPRARMLEVAEHYHHFDGRSPLNDQNRELIDALRQELDAAGIELPIYWGNRNWHPFLADTLQEMADRGIRRALAYVTSAYSCYSGCRQYREDIAAACAALGPAAPCVDKLRVFFNHPGFIEANAQRLAAALAQVDDRHRGEATLLFTAHSIPRAMADHCDYERQLLETARLVASQLGVSRWRLVYQSRSGPPQQPWLEPDVRDAISRIQQEGSSRDVVLAPIGFLSDHLEVMYDLDVEARQHAESLGLGFVRAETVGTHPRFVNMIRELIQERLTPGIPRRAVGELPARPDVCASDCCRSAASTGGRPG